MSAEPYRYMDIVQVLDYGEREVQAWEISEHNEQILTETGYGDWIIVPDAAGLVTVTLEVTGDAYGKVQTTTNKLTDLTVFGNPVTPVDWPAGDLYEEDTPYTDFTMPVTAFRVVMNGGEEFKIPGGWGEGTVKMTARAQ